MPNLSDENRERHAGLRIVDSIAWAHDELLPRLRIARRVARRRSIRRARPGTSA